MKCSVCGRNLRNPESQEIGYGPVCYKRLFGAKPKHKNRGGSSSEDAMINYDVPGQISMEEYLQSLQA